MLRFKNCPEKNLRELNEKEVKMFEILYRVDHEASDLPIKEFEKVFTYRLMKKRLIHTEAHVSDATVMLCAFMCKKAGEAVLWAANLAIDALDYGSIIDISVFTDLYPFGVPNDSYMKQCWESQKKKKAPQSNLLDTEQFWANPLYYIEPPTED